MRKILVAIAVIVVLTLGVVYAAGRGMFGSHEGPGDPVPEPRPAAVNAATKRSAAQGAAGLGVHASKQILFGDLHVHTTFSFDAFLLSLPLAVGEGAHPPADACDFARYCAALDFWSINDHAFSITPEHWRETVDSIRECNAVAGDSANPDMVSFLGWEWTQVGTTPDEHYGHKNVVLRGVEEGEVPPRPIAALRPGRSLSFPVLGIGAVALRQGGRIHDLARYFAELGATPECDDETPSPELPSDCIEFAGTPADLYRKLGEREHDSMVIPHGTTWGFYTPPGSSWDKQLVGDMHDEDRQILMEIYSGHGDSEVYRDWRAITFAADGSARCPEPTADYLPSCWRAGEIIRGRCLAAGESSEDCEARAVEARGYAAAAGVAGHKTVPGAVGADWLDSGQCRDCDQPSFNYRPASSAQYILALGNFDEDPASPRHFRMGFMSSSDNHFARPGTGYKELKRRGFTESQGASSADDSMTQSVVGEPPGEPEARARPFDLTATGFDLFEMERQASFFMTGGLIGVHSVGRDRSAIWDAMQQREVYGTSGPRMLLWFDLLNPPGSRGDVLPMGGEVTLGEAPIFRVRAVGSFEQKPGCPDYAASALGAEDLERICKGECYHPSDTRRPITRIEVVRIRPQQSPDEEIGDLIDDPWRSFACEPDAAGCAVTFTDPDFPSLEREAVYYVRAYEPPKPGVNAGGVRCERDASGACTSARLCGAEGDPNDDCLEEHEPRAWSSPIWLEPPATTAAR